MLKAFEELVVAKVFVCMAAAVPSIAKEFLKYRSIVGQEEVKKAVEKTGQINLRKWLTKAQ